MTDRSYLKSGPTIKTHLTSKSTLKLEFPNLFLKRRFSNFSVPDFENYRRPDAFNPEKNQNFTYFVVGATGVGTAMAAKSTVINFLSSVSAAADVLALAQIEVDLSTIPLGKNVIVKWRGKPVFIRHRTPDEIKIANQVNLSELRDPQEDSDRTKNADWLVVIGVCTHLGCVPIGESGDYDGWYCPCK